MKENLSFKIRQLFKMLLQNILLPCVHRFWCLLYRKKEKDQIILADSHHDEIPFSMLFMYHTFQKKGYSVVTDICDYRNLSFVQSALRSIRFMRLYARGKVIFICDNFLPVVSCRKDPQTTVVQLMHSCGLGKNRL